MKEAAMKKDSWHYEGEHDGKKVQARYIRGGILVRVHDPAGKKPFSEREMPKRLGLDAAAHQAAIQTDF
jgi:hypothetical protein